jgi:hypothetical protein
MFNPCEVPFSVMKAYYRTGSVLSQNPFEDVKEFSSKLTSLYVTVASEALSIPGKGVGMSFNLMN